jgi:hypothetical protein
VKKTVEQVEGDLRALHAMKDSRGWQIILDRVREDIIQAAIGMGGDPRMPESEMHFRRGAIYAASALLHVVDHLVTGAENDLLLAQASQAAGPLNFSDATAQGELL